ncbi:hypothetical protein BUE80_DR010828 [Diplocarpon rosae]|nr:hypothetical protein BUE80_DR010828 [Diplocarpon rosae]
MIDNLVLHLSLLSLFLFIPPRSWNLCFIASLLTLFLAQLISTSLNAVATSIPVLPTKIVRPVLGTSFIGTRDCFGITSSVTARSSSPLGEVLPRRLASREREELRSWFSTFRRSRALLPPLRLLSFSGLSASPGEGFP